MTGRAYPIPQQFHVSASIVDRVSDALVSGAFAVIGTALGWALSEAGAGWRRHAERQEAARAAADGRVFDAALAAGNLAEGLRALVGIDSARATHGEGVSHQTYEELVVDLQAELRRLRLVRLAMTARGPRAALPAAAALVGRAQELWDKLEALPRNAVPAAADQLLSDCDALYQKASELAATIPDRRP